MIAGAREIAAALLLGIGLMGFGATSLGLLLSDDVYDQIHFLAPGSLLGSIAIPAAVVFHEGFSQAGVKAMLIGIILIVSNPVLSHATARAPRIRRKNHLPPEAHEEIPFAGETE